jgi:tryptophanyl-tRNA synthetase
MTTGNEPAQQGRRLRVVSGMRPTGSLHIGHLQGALKNWLRLAEEHDCYYFSADWHALTTNYRDPSEVKAAEREMFADWLAVGLDPSKVVLFVQSDVKQHAELALLFGMITPVSWLERVPTYKEQQQQLADRDLSNFGFLGYPVLQTADVAVYNANAVPVGQDQVAHLELSREIVRRFNNFYGREGAAPVLAEPQPLLTEVPKILGLDGRKMSKSYGNAILLGEEEESARKKIMAAVTDPQRVRRHDPGNPEVCPIFYLHKSYSPPETVQWVDRECRTAGIGCVDCKKSLLVSLLPSVERHRKARAEIDKTPERIDAVMKEGGEKAAAVAEDTMRTVRSAMKLA